MSNGVIRTERTISGLRDVLFNEMDDFRNGKCSTKRAQTVINFAREIVQATRLEIVSSALQLERSKNGNKTLTLR